jgi:thiol-disulfide isomerase/thioredoxin
MKWCLVLVFLGACGVRSTEQFSDTPGQMRAIEEIQLINLDGGAVSPSQFEGKALFINVWATWCSPCVREMPSIAKAKQSFNGRPIEFLFASNEGPDIIQEFVKEHPFDVKFVRLENLEELNIQAMPTTFIFNGKGELIFSEAGFRQWDDSVSMAMIERIIGDK